MFPSNQWLRSGESDAVIELSSSLDSHANGEEEEESAQEEKTGNGA